MDAATISILAMCCIMQEIGDPVEAEQLLHRALSAKWDYN